MPENNNYKNARAPQLTRNKPGHFQKLLDYLQGCPTFWHLWATLEEEELFWATH